MDRSDSIAFGRLLRANEVGAVALLKAIMAKNSGSIRATAVSFGVAEPTIHNWLAHHPQIPRAGLAGNAANLRKNKAAQ